jgi:methionyl-tRNA synthetase
MSKKQKRDPILQEEEYVAFLKKQLSSDNYKAAVSPEEYKKTKMKYDKAKPKTKISKRHMKDQLEFSEFLEIEKKLEIKWGTITEVERVPKSEKLLKMKVSFGEDQRIVVTNLGQFLSDEKEMVFQKFPFVTNLKPTKIMGIESTAMIMVSTSPNGELAVKKDALMGQVFPVPGSTLL